MPEQSNDYRVVTFGTGGVGKTSLVLRFINGSFNDSYIPTIEDTYRKVCIVLINYFIYFYIFFQGGFNLVLNVFLRVSSPAGKCNPRSLNFLLLVVIQPNLTLLIKLFQNFLAVNRQASISYKVVCRHQCGHFTLIYELSNYSPCYI